MFGAHCNLLLKGSWAGAFAFKTALVWEVCWMGLEIERWILPGAVTLKIIS